MGLHRNAVLACAALLFSATLSATACSSKSSTSFGSTNGDDGGNGVGTDDGGSSSGGSSNGGSSGGINLGDARGSSSGLGTGTCKDGTYTGMYTCTFNFNDGGPAGAAGDAGGLVITGNLSFQLLHDMSSGESFIDTASGMFGGTCCLGAFSIASTLGGTLNCNSGTFSGTLTNGTYMGTGIWALFFMNGTFNGPLTADYNGSTFAFENGTWDLKVPGIGDCPGTWTATYTDQ